MLYYSVLSMYSLLGTVCVAVIQRVELEMLKYTVSAMIDKPDKATLLTELTFLSREIMMW